MNFSDLWDWLVDSWHFYRRHFFSLAAMVLPFAIPFALIQSSYLQQPEQSSPYRYWLYVGLGLLMQPIYQGAIILYMRAVFMQQRWSIAQCFQASLTIWPSLFLLIAMSFCLVMLGLSFFIFPGLVIASRLLVADIDCVMNKTPAIQAISNSWRQTESLKWPLLAGVVVVAGLTMVPVWGIHRFLLAHQAAELWLFINRVAGQLLEIFFLVFAYRVYSVIHSDKPSA